MNGSLSSFTSPGSTSRPTLVSSLVRTKSALRLPSRAIAETRARGRAGAAGFAGGAGGRICPVIGFGGGGGSGRAPAAGLPGGGSGAFEEGAGFPGAAGLAAAPAGFAPGAAKACVYCGALLGMAAAASAGVSLGLANRPARDPLIGATVGGRFKVEELIGQGGMGKVYRARHLALDRLVCLKMLKPTLLEDPTLVGRFEREAKAASRLNHPNVIQVLDFGRNEPDGALFIAMEYVQGKDLRIVLRDEWPVPEQRLCGIIGQAL